MVGRSSISCWFLCLTVAHPSPLERIADPSDTGYVPMPDWYFIFLYQLLKYEFAAGPYTVVGAMVIPGIAFGALLLAPFIDRGPERRPSKRPLATGFMLLAIAAITFLTWQGVDAHDWEAAKEYGKIQAQVDIDKTSDGYNIANEQSCLTCHGENLQGSAAAPSLVGLDLTAEEIAKIATDGKNKMPAGIFKGTDEELQKLSEFITGLAE